jgi:hypothetical protein
MTAIRIEDVQSQWLGDVKPLPRIGFEVAAPYKDHTHVIYALLDDGGVFYVGQTIARKAYIRVRHHITAAKIGRDKNRMKSVRLLKAHSNSTLIVRILAFASSQSAANHLEKFYMFFFGFQEGKLTNIAQGGVGGFDPSSLDGWKEYIYSDENRRRASVHSKEMWTNPERKAAMTEKVHLHWTKDRRADHAELFRSKWDDPEYVSKVMTARSTPELVRQSKERNRKLMTARWEDDDYRESQVAIRRTRASDPEWREKMRLINREIGLRPEVKQKRSENAKSAWTPERRKKHSELIKSLAAAKRAARGEVS